MSPTQGVSGLERSKRRVRLEVGSRVARWVVVQSEMGVGWALRVEGGGG